VDYLILCLAGICLGTLAKVSDETFGALGYTYTVIAVCKYEKLSEQCCLLFSDSTLQPSDAPKMWLQLCSARSEP
jgi:hypothetical protein